MDSGWARWILEQYTSSRSRKVFAPTLDAGNLNAKYDVIIFVEGGIPALGATGGQAQPAAEDIPAEYRPLLGRVTAERTIPALKQFVENGGTVITIGASSTNLARHFALPIADHLVENGKPLPAAKFYAPGSVMTAKLDVTHPIAHGMNERTDIFFDTSPVFRLEPTAASQGVKAFAWFDSAAPLKSGWAWGQQYLQNGVAAIDAPMGQGTRAAVRTGDHEARPAARHVQVPVQRARLRGRRSRRGDALRTHRRSMSSRPMPPLPPAPKPTRPDAEKLNVWNPVPATGVHVRPSSSDQSAPWGPTAITDIFVPGT